MLGVAIGAFLLLLAVGYLIARPLLMPETAVEEAEDSKLVAEKERQLAAIRELDLDFATGKLTEEDYRKLRAQSLAETAATMRALDQADAEASAEAAVADAETEAEEPANTAADEQPARELAGSNGHATAEEDDLERAIAARKRSIEEKAP